MAANTTYSASPEMRKKYRFLNALLVLVLTFLTVKKILAVIMVGSFHLYSLTGLVVPAINIYFIRLIMQYQKTGYQFLCILSILALLYPENRQPIEFGLHLLMIVLCIHLLLVMFPRSKTASSSK